MLSYTTLAAAALSLTTAAALYGLVVGLRRRSFYRNVPGPPHSLFWGHLKEFGIVAKSFPANTHLQAFFIVLKKKYDLPDIFYIDLWPLSDPMMIISDPDIASQVSTLKPYPKHPEVGRFLLPFAGTHNIAAVNGEEWKHLHRILSPPFASSNIKNLIPIMAEETVTYRGHLEKLAESGETFSMEDVAGKLVFDIIGRVVFSSPLYAQTTGSDCLTNLRIILKYAAVERLTWNPFEKTLAGFKRRSAAKIVDAFLLSKIKERYAFLKGEKLQTTKKSALSILDLLLRDRIQETNVKEGSQSTELDPYFLNIAVTNMKALLIGGHGTTADTLCFIFMMLSTEPTVIKQLREEHDRIFHPSMSKTLDILRENPYKVNELDYTTAVIKETLRLFPVGFGIRMAPENGGPLVVDGENFPTKDQMIIPCQHTMHYNPSIFPQPSKFLPSRFLDPENPIPRNAWRPFERGPRGCMGQELAIDELRVTLLLTVRDFEFEVADVKRSERQKFEYTDLDCRYGDLIFQELGMEAKPRGGMMMKVRRRSSENEV